MKKLSVIIPAYQAEKQIQRCVGSVIANEIDMEVLIVNDGSTDRTEEICRQMAERDDRISVWSKDNGGPGAAREFALVHARGEYIAFADADDFVEPGTFDYVFGCISNEIDIIEFGYRTVKESGEEIAVCRLAAEEYSGKDCGRHYARQKNTTNFLWNKIFRRTLFQNVTIPHLYTGEDAVALAQLFTYAEHCKVVDYIGYSYVMTSDSICRQPFSKRRLDSITAWWQINDFYAQKQPELCFYSKQKICSIAALLYCEVKNLKEQKDKENICRELICEYQKARQNLTVQKLLSHGSNNRRIMLGLFELSPNLCAFVFNLV